MKIRLLPLLMLAACPPSDYNPPELWLAPAESSAAVTLADTEPQPFRAPGLGVGDPLEGTFELGGPLHAGTWQLIGDGIILQPVDMRFDVLWRGPGGDQVIVSFTHHFEVPDGDAADDAVLFEADAVGEAVDARAGDLLVLRMTATHTASPGPAYIPNADGVNAHGRIPSLTLP